jgi:hypothetical protein
MARDKTDKTDVTPVATPATSATKEGGQADDKSLNWNKEKVAEDELSVLWKLTAKIETSDQAFEAARQTQTDNFWPHIETWANSCDETLAKHGFPHASEMVRHDGAGNWWRHPPDLPMSPPLGETWNFTRGEALAQEFSDDFSDPWYAGKLGFKCRIALEIYRNDDASKALLFEKVFEIATLGNDWKWRKVQKPSILTGRKQRKVLATGRNVANSNRQQDVSVRRAEILRMKRETNLSGGALQKYLQRRLFNEAEISASTRNIRRDLAALKQL